MKSESYSQFRRRSKLSKILLSLTTLYGTLYIILIISFYKDGFIGFNLEAILISLAFLVFLVGYYFCWKNELMAGIIFILWWGIMWYLGLFIAEQDKGAGVVMGAPLFILGILFVFFWYRNRQKNFNNVK